MSRTITVPQGTLHVRRGASIARDVLIDWFISDKDLEALYDKWQPEWPEPESHPGGVKAITCDMVIRVPETELKKVYGKARSGRILAAANEHTEV